MQLYRKQCCKVQLQVVPWAIVQPRAMSKYALKHLKAPMLPLLKDQNDIALPKVVHLGTTLPGGTVSRVQPL